MNELEILRKQNERLKEGLNLAVKSAEFFMDHADCKNDTWLCRCSFCRDMTSTGNLKFARQVLKECEEMEEV